MIYMSRTRRDPAMTDEDRTDAFVEQFSPSRSLEISGFMHLLVDYHKICGEVISHPDLTEEQREIYRNAGSLAGYDLEDHLDYLTDEYAAEGVEDGPERRVTSPAPFLAAGYQHGVTTYTQVTNDLLSSSAFSEKEHGSAKSFYMAVGLGLAEELERLLRDPDVYLQRLTEYADRQASAPDEH